jgi:hypothetical protein
MSRDTGAGARGRFVLAKHNYRSAKALLEQIRAEGYDEGYGQLNAFV